MHGSQWKVFKKWTDGHQTWYNLGGDQWVKSDYARYSKLGQVVTGITTNINGSITVKYTPGYGIYIRKGLLCQESGHKSTNKFDFQFKLLNLIFGGRSFSPVQILKTL